MGSIDGKDIMRPYTPIECRPDCSEFDCIIKIYPDGVFTQYLNTLEISATVTVRGVFSDLLFVAGKNQLQIPGFS